MRTERLARGLVGGPPGAGPLAGAALPPQVVPAARPVVAPAAAAPGLPVLPLAVVAAAPQRQAGPLGTWVVDEPVESSFIGAEVILPAGALVFGSRSLVRVGDVIASVTKLEEGTDIEAWAQQRAASFLIDDRRAFATRSQAGSFTLAQASVAMTSGTQPLSGLKGPATVADTLRSVLDRSGGYMAAHDRWVVEARIEGAHRSKYEHKVISRTFHLAIFEDGLNVKGLTSFEYLNRRKLLLEEAHRLDPSRPNFEHAHVFMGEDEDVAGGHMSSALRAHVASELAKESAIQKERRKAAEAREAVSKRGKNQKGDAP